MQIGYDITTLVRSDGLKPVTVEIRVCTKSSLWLFATCTVTVGRILTNNLKW